MHLYTKATEMARIGYSTKKSIDRLFASNGRHAINLFCVWRFLCVRDAGRRGNKTTAV